MTFDEWFHKEYEPADLQIKQYAERKEGLHIPATVYLEDLKKAFEAGLHTDVHTDNSKVIAELKASNEMQALRMKERDDLLAELKAQIEKTKCCGNCAKNGHICVAEEMQGKLCGKNKDKWELRR